ncbi:hypothetical protein C0992_010560 [Termitomyces sp. T32_za158]|nr:hypothetical protein C0992_010560 [Termitomyces sp. T32_za158]
MTANMQGLNQALPRKLLIDILKEPFDYDPILFAKSSQTTDIFASKAKDKREALAAVEPKLTHIVPCPNLVRQLMPELTKALDDIWTLPGDRLSMRVYPKYNMVPLTRAIHSEKDSEDVFLGLYLHPALSLLGFLKAKEKVNKGGSSKKYTNDQIMEYKEMQGFGFKLYAASVTGAAHIADLGVYELRSKHEAVLHLPIEIKTPAAFPEKLFSQISPRISSGTAETQGIYDMGEHDMKKIQGWAVQFNWPSLDENFGNSRDAKLNKVLSQVWNQMVEHKKRKDLASGHLYISPPSYPNKDGLIDMVIWTLKAAGYIKGDINVPAISDHWWKQADVPTGPGVNTE